MRKVKTQSRCDIAFRRILVIIFHKTVNYDNILDKFEYKHSSAKVKVTAVILGTDHTNGNYDSILIEFKFQFSRDKVAILRKTLLAFLCLHLWTDFDISSYKC